MLLSHTVGEPTVN